jgi:hypothetical protein
MLGMLTDWWEQGTASLNEQRELAVEAVRSDPTNVVRCNQSASDLEAVQSRFTNRATCALVTVCTAYLTPMQLAVWWARGYPRLLPLTALLDAAGRARAARLRTKHAAAATDGA